jgi:hypothetical protein
MAQAIDVDARYLVFRICIVVMRGVRRNTEGYRKKGLVQLGAGRP